MYNPYWWYLNDEELLQNSYNCTNSEILEAINTTLFIGAQNLKYQVSLAIGNIVLLYYM